MAKKGKEMDKCTPKCMGSKLLILGILILLNANYNWFSWANFIGGILVIKALIMIAMPVCKCHKK